MYRKPFSKELWEAYDAQGKDIVRNLDFWNEHFFNGDATIKLEDHPNRYEIDLIDDNYALVVEVEVRPAWRTHDFKFDTLNVPQRKGKMLQKWVDKGYDVYFAAVNKNGTQVAIVNAEDVLSSSLEKSWNKYARGGSEKFYKVPLDMIFWRDV